MSKLAWLRGYYALLAYVIFAFGFKRFSGLEDSPGSFLPGMDLQTAGLTFLFLTVAVSFVAVWKPQISWLRRLVFLFFLIFEIEFNDVGSETHLYQFWLWSSCALALMPTLKEDQVSEEHLDWGIRTALSIVLIMYFLSGFWKTIGVFQQIFLGEAHLLTQKGLFYHIFSEIIRAKAKPLLLNFLGQNPWLNPILGFSVITIQLGCLVGVFKTKWHRVIGVLLFCFHVGTAMILDITYPTNSLLVIWCFILSPFARPLEYRADKKGEPS